MLDGIARAQKICGSLAFKNFFLGSLAPEKLSAHSAHVLDGIACARKICGSLAFKKLLDSLALEKLNSRLTRAWGREQYSAGLGFLFYD